MFIARSAARVRFARTVFLLVGLLPCAALVAAAVYLRSDDARERVRREWQRAAGLPLALGMVEWPRPGMVRGRDCILVAASGEPIVSAEVVDVETSATEVRLRIAGLACDAAAVHTLVGIVGEWLARPAVFSRDCVVEIAGLTWVVRQPAAGGKLVASQDGRPAEREGSRSVALGPLRLECVARGDSRAVRVVLGGGQEGPAGEVRAMLAPEVVAGVPSARLDVDAVCRRPLPLGLVAAAAGSRVAGDASDAVSVLGQLQTVRSLDRWSGSVTGMLENVDLAHVAGVGPGGASGMMSFAVRRFEWHDDRLGSCTIDWLGNAGRVGRRLFDTLVAAGLFRRGVTVGAGSESIDFDAASGTLSIDDGQVRITPLGAAVGILARWRGQPVAEAVSGAVPVRQLVSLWEPRGPMRGTQGGAVAWLVSVLPEWEAGPADARATDRGPAASPRVPHPTRVGRRAEF